MQPTCETVKQSILQNKLIVIVRGIPTAYIADLAEALYSGGIRLMEIPILQDAGDGGKETMQSISLLAGRMRGRMHIGAGTVMSEAQVKMAAEAGAEYCVSPNVDERVIRASKEAGLVSIPGGLTPTEIAGAYNMGADFVKVFPISCFGAPYLKAIHAPLSHIPMIAVGGVRPEMIPELTKAGACGFGVGGVLADKKLILSRDFARITEEARRYCETV